MRVDGNIITVLNYVKYVLQWFCFCFCLVSLRMAIDVVGVPYNGGFLPDIILLTQCYYHRGTRLNASMKMTCIYGL